MQSLMKQAGAQVVAENPDNMQCALKGLDFKKIQTTDGFCKFNSCLDHLRQQCLFNNNRGRHYPFFKLAAQASMPSMSRQNLFLNSTALV